MTDAKLARCPRCKAYALVAERQGIRVAVDIAPADALGFGNAVASGVDLYWAENVPGRPAKLLGRLSAAQGPSWGPGGQQQGTQRLHREHSCGAPARDMVLIGATAPKDSAPATPGAAGDGLHLLGALGSSAPDPAPPSPATTATLRRSEKALRCSTCRKLIDRTKPHFAIEFDTYRWGNCEECE